MNKHYFTPPRTVKPVSYILTLNGSKMRVQASHRAMLELVRLLLPRAQEVRA
ncbi:MAG: hypothetical protein IJD16_07305 [Desulfovibrio sp.]|nr:hypothetical protein [Desulfovibrio sp.]